MIIGTTLDQSDQWLILPSIFYRFSTADAYERIEKQDKHLTMLSLILFVAQGLSEEISDLCIYGEMPYHKFNLL